MTDIAEHRRRLSETQAKLARIQAQRQTAAPGGRSRQPHSTPLQRVARRQAKLAAMLDRQLPAHRVRVEIPSGRHLPLSPRFRSWMGELIASCGATVSLRSRSLRLERRGEPVPDHLIDAVSNHAGPLAAWIRAHRCGDCDRDVRLQPSGSPAGASWQLACPGCGDVNRP